MALCCHLPSCCPSKTQYRERERERERVVAGGCLIVCRWQEWHFHVENSKKFDVYSAICTVCNTKTYRKINQIIFFFVIQ